MSQCQFIINFKYVILQLEIQADEYYYGDNSDRQEDPFYIWLLSFFQWRSLLRYNIKNDDITE